METEENQAKTAARIDNVRQMIDHELSSCERVLAKFAGDIQENAHHALEWSGEVFEAAARQRVYRIAAAQLAGAQASGQALEVLSRLRLRAYEEVWRRGRHPQRSTSPAANLMDQLLGTAWAYLYELLAAVGGVQG